MGTDAENTQTTHDRLLAAACELFGEMGYRETTVAEICSRANANIAAVNYHFRSKDDLYVAAWRHSFDVSLRAHPPDGGIPADAPPEARFRGRVLALLQRMLDPACHEFRIVSHEMAHPTGLLVEVLHEAILPLREAMLNSIRELTGDTVDERTCHFCMMSIMSQCLHLVHGEWHRRIFQSSRHPVRPPEPANVTVEELAEHIVRFSLAAIRGIAQEERTGRDNGEGVAG